MKYGWYKNIENIKPYWFSSDVDILISKDLGQSLSLGFMYGNYKILAKTVGLKKILIEAFIKNWCHFNDFLMVFHFMQQVKMVKLRFNKY